MNLVELVCEKITWYKCKICGIIFNEGNKSKQHGCLLCSDQEGNLVKDRENQ